MEDRETARMRKYGESKTTRIMMATVPHVISGLGLRKFQADGFLLTQVYQLSHSNETQKLSTAVLSAFLLLWTSAYSCWCENTPELVWCLELADCCDQGAAWMMQWSLELHTITSWYLCSNFFLHFKCGTSLREAYFHHQLSKFA